MTDPSVPDDGDARSRLSRLESAVAALESVAEGHASWLADLERETATGPEATPDVAATLAAHTEWLATLERWVSSCVKTLANFGAQPLDSAEPSASIDLTSSLMTRLEVPTVMSWITDAAEVPDGPMVSVTIATRDRPHLLRRAIDSVLGQSYRRLELIVRTTPTRTRPPTSSRASTTPGSLSCRPRPDGDPVRPTTSGWLRPPVTSSPSWTTTTHARGVAS